MILALIKIFLLELILRFSILNWRSSLTVLSGVQTKVNSLLEQSVKKQKCFPNDFFPSR